MNSLEIANATKQKNKKAVIVMPTYNERENIGKILPMLLTLEVPKLWQLEVLVVDDNSPDGTANVVKQIQSVNEDRVHLVLGKKEGLGAAYKRGISYAITTLEADVVIEMDADLSHNPLIVPKMLQEINKGATFVIGSRYVEGGSVDENWPLMRRLNSWGGKTVAKFVPELRQVQDTTGGFRAICKEVIDLKKLKSLRTNGYAFQICILTQALRKGAVVKEIPIYFKDRVNGVSKIRLADKIEFFTTILQLRFQTNILVSVISTIAGLSLIALMVYGAFFAGKIGLEILFALGSIFVGFLGMFTIWQQMYTWEDQHKLEKAGKVSITSKPFYSITALIPARHEEAVIAETIKSLADIDYPEHLKQFIIILRDDDVKTIEVVRNTLKEIGDRTIQMHIFSGMPINKPHGLNKALADASGDLVCVFDAEDRPHKDIFNYANHEFLQSGADIVQAGVQLVTPDQNWFSLLNCLEYYFWFSSSLHYFASQKMITLGGNTVFFKEHLLQDGWDQDVLTEDADIGISSTVNGAKIHVCYSCEHATQEETPSTASQFIKQRTRWVLGFFQVFLKGEWLQYPTWRQRLLAMYVLLVPFVNAFYFFLSIIMLALAPFLKISVLATMATFFPLSILLIQLLIQNIGAYEFYKKFNLPYNWKVPFRILFSFFPYNFILAVSSFRAFYKLLINELSWEKTLHVNAHSKTDIRNVEPAHAK